jgi:hypothetical protein
MIESAEKLIGAKSTFKSSVTDGIYLLAKKLNEKKPIPRKNLIHRSPKWLN